MRHNEQSLDSKVLEILENREIWKVLTTSGTTAEGYFVVRRSELEKYLKLSRKQIVSSLDCLESAGEIFNDGVSIDQPDDPQYYRVPS
jgi:predicted transcriptional regulator